MCGICGVVRFDEAPSAADDGDVERMLGALAHRGPDDTGSHVAEHAIVAATRLSIRGIDDGHQPFVDAETGVAAVCNGEIDNHEALRGWLASQGREVKQRTDVAVVLPLYLALGEAFVEQLVGAFAIAIWDPRQGRLLLARDRAGERPLFFQPLAGGLRFATEVAALASIAEGAPRPSLPALQHYLRLGVFRAPEAPFEGVEKLGPGEIAVADARGVRRRRYWRWDLATSQKRRPDLDDFDGIFREAVRRQSEVDVEVGLFLSGGLDSSLVGAVARSLRPGRTLRAYTARFEDASFDEGAFAESVARRIGAEFVPVRVGPEDVPEQIAALVHAVGEPLADPAWIPTAMLARRAAKDVRLALVGEGADELFGGYPTYLGISLARGYARLPQRLRRSLRRAAENRPPSEKKVTLSYLLRRFVAAEGLEGLARHVFWVSNASPAVLRRLGLPATPLDGIGAAGTPLDLAQQWDLETSLAEGLLTKADRASMLSSVELRAPFLDPAVMAFAATLSPRDRVAGLTTKVFLKRYARRYLPRSIVHRRKRGLSVPLAAWLRRPLRDWAATRLGAGELERAGVRSEGAVELLQQHVSGAADHARVLWSLLVLVEWLEWSDEHTCRPLPTPDARRGAGDAIHA